jgi:uncharacterized membrane protein YeaQ/YmgE (transglycosylase-associated protein family)
MNVLLWIFVGWIAGRLAGRSLEDQSYGPSMDVVMGIGGAMIGGLLMRSAGFSGYTETILTTFAAMSCALLSATLSGLVNGGRIYSRQLWEPAKPKAQRVPVENRLWFE